MDLIDEAVAGNSEAIGELCEEHRRFVEKLFRWKWNLPDYAEDLTQEVFVVVVQRISEFRKDCKFKTWLWYIARGVAFLEFSRLALIHCGGGGRTVKTRKKVERFVEVVPVDETFPDVSHSELRLIDAVTMQAALVQLAADQQMAVTACDLKGYTTYEYARQIGVPRSTVVGRLRRGHVHLKAILGSTADMPSTAG